MNSLRLHTQPSRDEAWSIALLSTPQGELAGQVRQALGLGDGPLARFPELLEERFPLDVDFSPLPAMSALGATDPAALDEVLEEMAPGR